MKLLFFWIRTAVLIPVAALKAGGVKHEWINSDTIADNQTRECIPGDPANPLIPEVGVTLVPPLLRYYEDSLRLCINAPDTNIHPHRSPIHKD